MELLSKNGYMEFTVTTGQPLVNPFWDAEVYAVFTQGGNTVTQPAFYAGQDGVGHRFTARWAPPRTGAWHCRFVSAPALAGLGQEMDFTVEGLHPRGCLRARPGAAFGFVFDSGEPCLLLGDTMYNLFGAHYCGVDVERILRRRREQGVNCVRARMAVSPFHPPHVFNTWQTRDCWPWGGSPQCPDFTRFNLDYFQAVDEVFTLMETLGMGLEVILEAWMFEFPFSDRSRFLPEYEQLWCRYVIARYGASPAVYLWCPANEYDYYPGEPKYHPVADRWLRRLAADIRTWDPCRHPIGAHQWEKSIPLQERLGSSPDMDVYLVQTAWDEEPMRWGRDASLCLGVEEQVRRHCPGGEKVLVCAEFGYERVPGMPTVGIHDRMDPAHTRRGMWRAGFCGWPVFHGFNNTWGPYMTVEPDAAGVAFLPIFRDFMTRQLNFAAMTPAPELLRNATGSLTEGTLPLCLAQADRSVAAVYFPARGSCAPDLPPGDYEARWLDPRTGALSEPALWQGGAVSTPETQTGGEPWGDDWVLLLRREG